MMEDLLQLIEERVRALWRLGTGKQEECEAEMIWLKRKRGFCARGKEWCRQPIVRIVWMRVTIRWLLCSPLREAAKGKSRLMRWFTLIATACFQIRIWRIWAVRISRSWRFEWNCLFNKAWKFAEIVLNFGKPKIWEQE
jgi:hypothetical protein